MDRAPVAIVDFGMGNLFSVQMACAAVGFEAVITSKPSELLSASAVIIPGVGAFGDAMRTLERSGVATAIHEFASSGRTVMGICLGLQLMLTESHEFGHHRGLGLIAGEVVPLPGGSIHQRRRLKVPNVGWSPLCPSRPWEGTLLEDVRPGASMYFVHSYRVRPADAGTVLATTTYGDLEFPCALASGNLFGTQFHPERSGLAGLAVYRGFARRLAAESARV